MKKITLILTVAIIAFLAFDLFFKGKISEVGDVKEKSQWDVGETVVTTSDFDIVYEDIIYSYDKNKLTSKCKEHEAICAVDLMVRCTINPKMKACVADRLPQFVFMEDKYLGRPSQQAFKVTKIKPIDKNTVEIFTEGTCDGQWFGLCSGKVIYVVDNVKGFWRVKDVYAIAAS